MIGIWSGDWTDKIGHGDRDQRLSDVFRQALLVFSSKSGGRLADRHDILDERD
jgi:hypothetical protein